MAVQLRGLGDLLLDCQCGAMVCARCKLWIEAQLIIGLQVIQRCLKFVLKITAKKQLMSLVVLQTC